MRDQSMRGREIIFVPLPILLACPVPVTPDGRTMTDDGEPDQPR